MNVKMPLRMAAPVGRGLVQPGRVGERGSEKVVVVEGSRPRISARVGAFRKEWWLRHGNSAVR